MVKVCAGRDVVLQIAPRSKSGNRDGPNQLAQVYGTHHREKQVFTGSSGTDKSVTCQMLTDVRPTC